MRSLCHLPYYRISTSRCHSNIIWRTPCLVCRSDQLEFGHQQRPSLQSWHFHLIKWDILGECGNSYRLASVNVRGAAQGAEPTARCEQLSIPPCGVDSPQTSSLYQPYVITDRPGILTFSPIHIYYICMSSNYIIADCYDVT